MFQETRKIILASVVVMMASLTSAMAFDLADYATTYRETSDAYTKASESIKSKEAAYEQAFKNRIKMEQAVRLAEKQIALAQDPQDETSAKAVEAAEAEIIKLNALQKSAGSCGI
jgi:hypothetical protein